MVTRSATVRYSYKAAHEDELDLEVDDVIDVLEEAETGWMKGKLRNTGRIGLFPTNFVQFFGDLLSENSTSALTLMVESPKNRVNSHISDSTTVGKKESNCHNKSNSRGHELLTSLARVLFTYSPKHEDELPLREVGQIIGIVSKSSEDPGWLLAEIDGRQGLIPDNFVEILRPAVPTTTTNSETHKMPLPPNVPAKPASKPLALSSGTGRRATTSSVFAQMHSSLADAFTKPPKQFAARVVKTEESSAVEGRPGDRLSHITATRPKQPNKRPPSTIFRTKSNEASADDGVIVTDLGRISPTTSTASSLSNSCVQQPSSTTSTKSVKGHQALSPRRNSSDDEFVPRSEYNRLVQQFEELVTTMNKFRMEMSQKISILEAKITKQ
uniref:SH3 domain-containing protein n=1 Tax=Setaria digitata TaxID=48799 RepID=A0A915Q3Q9_9BILA